MSGTRQPKNQQEKKNERPDRLGTNVYSSDASKSMHKSLNGEFTFYQLLIEQVFDEKQSLTNKKISLVEYFKPTEKTDKKILVEFDTKYKPEKAIHWYTRETCIYKVLNKALRTQNMDNIFPFASFIRDINSQLSDEHRLLVEQQKTSGMTVYRGQLISKDEVTLLKSNQGQLLSINSFLSTSTNREKALEFARSQSPPNDELTTILLEIQTDLQAVTKPYADIKHLSAFSKEEEVLFMFSMVFRIENVFFDEENKIWRAKLIACSQADPTMNDFSSSLGKEFDGLSRFIALGYFYIEMLQYDNAENHFLNIIDRNLAKDDLELAFCYHGLAQANNEKSNSRLAIVYANQALEYLLNNPSLSEHRLVSSCYNELGSSYTLKKDYVSALQCLSKALSAHSDNNKDKTRTYSNLADVHFKMADYQLALEYFEKTLEHQPETSYALIGNTYKEMGKVYGKLNKKEKATEFFDKAIEYQLKELPAEHPDVSCTYNDLGLVMLDFNDQEKAFECFEKVRKLQSDSLPSNHPDFADAGKNLANYYMKQDNLEKALFYQIKVAENQSKTLSSTHSSTIDTCQAIKDIYVKQKDFKQASIYILKILDAQLERKLDDSSLTISYHNLEHLSLDKSNLDQALSLCLRALDLELETILQYDLSLILLYKTIGDIFYEKHRLDQSLVYYYHLLDCHLQNKPFNQSNIDLVYTYIGKVYLKKSHFNKTILFYEKMNNSPSVNDTCMDAHQLIDDIFFEKRHAKQSLYYFEKFLDANLKSHSTNNSILVKTYYILANIYFEQNKFNKALKYFLQVLNNELKQPILDLSLKNLYKAISTIYFQNNNYTQSLIYLNRLLDLQLQTKTIEHSSIGATCRMIGNIYLKKKSSQLYSDYMNNIIENAFNNNLSKKTLNNTNAPPLNDPQFEKRHLRPVFIYYRKLFDSNNTENQSFEDICTILGNISIEQRNFDQAFIFFKRLLDIQQKRNPFGDKSSARTRVILGHMYAHRSHTSDVTVL
ncbi:unnamed protein product [Rotaria magnacalcarata]|uniref:NAD(P)(+)--arginine ADP-ribosyltransferase n=2 Tax=Rotaria magnacalcarata TaxID=392030 RepID=A0A816UKS4_9BILA|nr:unnamed protein product [Rotaria magnacalcarata]CAF4025693.1 unnamed protein product [Rotaria magnacalcarata]